MKIALLIFTAITLCSCSSYEPKTYRVTTTVKMECPKEYIYNSYDGMCYNLKPLYETIRTGKAKTSPTHSKRLKTAKKTLKEPINCVKSLHYCGVNNGTL